MKSKLKTYFICLLMIIVNVYIWAQSSVLDAGLRCTFMMKYKFNEKNTLSIRSRILQMENYTQTKRITLDIGYWYKINESVKFSLHYMYRLHRLADGYFIPLHRYYIRLDYRYSINKYIELYHRFIFQHTTHRFITDMKENDYKPYYKTDIRKRIGITYHLSSKSNIYFQNEIMYSLFDIPAEIKRNRLYLGFEKEMNDHHTIKIYIILQSALHSANNPTYHHFILGFDWTLDWN